jgi:N-formylglutamate amidohydrolase
MEPIWHTDFGDGPLVACALHDGHEVRPDVADCFRLSAAQRRYEEDPYTASWTHIAPTRIVARRSRFELDLNRPRDKAVYITPADAWGLDIWKYSPSPQVIEQSLRAYDDFYAHLDWLLERLVGHHGRVVVFDLHSYNHGRDGAPADAVQNPEINLGTGTMNRSLWAPIIDRWLAEMRAHDYFGRRLDVRENVKFFGGHFPEWIHRQFPETVCALAIEVKKFFMDERSGALDARQHAELQAALARAARGVENELENLNA